VGRDLGRGLLRLHSANALDWDNLAEEIKASARNDQRDLASRVQTVLDHLIRLRASPAVELDEVANRRHVSRSAPMTMWLVEWLEQERPYDPRRRGRHCGCSGHPVRHSHAPAMRAMRQSESRGAPWAEEC
jgi:hypothetical protein